jgi:hypothetical protein
MEPSKQSIRPGWYLRCLANSGTNRTSRRVEMRIRQLRTNTVNFISRLTYLVGLITFAVAPVWADEDVSIHLWQSDSQLKGGKVATCSVLLTTANVQESLTMNLGLLIEKPQLLTMLKITVHRQASNRPHIPVKIHSAWIRSSSGSSIGKLKQINTHPNQYYLGGADGADVFRVLLPGIMKNGISVGYQERPNTFDKVLKVSEPLPNEAVKSLVSCMEELRAQIETFR